MVFLKYNHTVSTTLRPRRMSTRIWVSKGCGDIATLKYQDNEKNGERARNCESPVVCKGLVS